MHRTGLSREDRPEQASSVAADTCTSPVRAEHTGSAVSQEQSRNPPTGASPLSHSVACHSCVDFTEQQSALQQQLEEVCKERRALRRERDALDEEKRRMPKFAVQSSDIIKLNVGGTHFTTTRDTLCAQPDTLLAGMFSGRWEESVGRDEEGCVYLDLDGELFGLLLNYLRDTQLAAPGVKIALPQCVSEKRQTYGLMLEYLGFVKQGTTCGGMIAFARTPPLTHSKLIVSADGKSVKPSTAEYGPFWALSEGVCVTDVALQGRMADTSGLSQIGIVPANTTAYTATDDKGYFFVQAPDKLYVFGDVVPRVPVKFVVRPNAVFALTLSEDGVLTLSDPETGEAETIRGVCMTHAYRFAFKSCGTMATISLV